MFLERRRKLRTPCDLNIKINKASGEQIRSKSDNLSVGGIALRTAANFYCGESVVVQFSLYCPEIDIDTRIEAISKVSHLVKLTHPANTAMVGLQFCNLNQRVEDMLKSYIDHIRSKTFQHAS